MLREGEESRRPFHQGPAGVNKRNQGCELYRRCAHRSTVCVDNSGAQVKHWVPPHGTWPSKRGTRFPCLKFPRLHSQPGRAQCVVRNCSPTLCCGSHSTTLSHLPSVRLAYLTGLLRRCHIGQRKGRYPVSSPWKEKQPGR